MIFKSSLFVLSGLQILAWLSVQDGGTLTWYIWVLFALTHRPVVDAVRNGICKSPALSTNSEMHWKGLLCPAPNRWGIKRWCCLTSVCLSRTLGLSREQRGPRKTKIGTEVVHVRRDSDTTFQGQRSRSPGCFTHRGLNASGSCSGEHGNVLGVGNYCYVAVCRRGGLGGVRHPQREERGGGISWPPPTYSLLSSDILYMSSYHLYKCVQYFEIREKYFLNLEQL